jgi:hypothetical protein
MSGRRSACCQAPNGNSLLAPLRSPCRTMLVRAWCSVLHAPSPCLSVWLAGWLVLPSCERSRASEGGRGWYHGTMVETGALDTRRLTRALHTSKLTPARSRIPSPHTSTPHHIPQHLTTHHNTSPHTASPHLTTTPPLLATFGTAMKKGKAYIFAMHIVNGHVPQAPPSISITLLAGAAPGGFSSVRLSTP